jgi:two-component system, chemotaxis family, protein-glutamate methylesterase/glutaminase
MKKDTLTLIFLEDSYQETELIQRATSRLPNLITIGHAQSELKLIRMLKEFIPDVLLIKAEMVTYEFLLKIYPLLNNSKVKILVYSPNFSKENVSKNLFQKLKFTNKISFLHLKSTDDDESLRDKIVYQLNCFSEPDQRPISYFEKKSHHKKIADKIIIIGSSAGGPRILKYLLAQYPPVLPAAIIIVQHIPFLFSQTLVESLKKDISMEIKEAEEDEPLMEGVMYVAKGDYHLEVVLKQAEVRLHLNQSPKIWSVRPAIDITMASAAGLFKDKIVGIILTGIGKDGSEGVREIKKSGGVTIAQNEETSMIFGMPKSAIETGCIDYILPYYQIADVSINLILKL